MEFGICLMISPIHIIGHLNPDTDAIASAMGYAWLLRERDGKNAIPARAGAVNPQTAWVLKTLGLEPPAYLADASPRFERIARTLPPILPDRPLREAWAVTAASHCGAPIVEADGQPLGLITGASVFRFFSRQLEERLDLENVSVARVLAVPCGQAMDPEVPRFPMTMRVRDGRNKVVREERDDFFVTRAWARLMLAETLALAGRMSEASEEAAAGLAHYDAKGDVTGAARARERLERLGIEVER